MPAPDILTPADRLACRRHALRVYRCPALPLTARHALVVARYLRDVEEA